MGVPDRETVRVPPFSPSQPPNATPPHLLHTSTFYTSQMDGKPNVLVLGATGFIGRNLVKYLVENDLAAVTSVDKVLPSLSYLSPQEETLFEKANFMQKNLVSPVSIASIWSDTGIKFDYVINCAAETKLQCEEDLKKIPGLSVVVARPAIVYGPGDK